MTEALHTEALEAIDKACATLADAGYVDDAWTIRAVCDALTGENANETAGCYGRIRKAVAEILAE